MKTILLLPLILITGCASLTTDQRETKEGVVETRTTVRTFFAGKSELTKLRTTLTDKTQGMSLGTLNQDANLQPIIEAVIRAAMAARTVTP